MKLCTYSTAWVAAQEDTPTISFRDSPRFSPLMVSLVPGGPSLGDTPLTTGLGGPSSIPKLAYRADDANGQCADANKSTPLRKEGVARLKARELRAV